MSEYDDYRVKSRKRHENPYDQQYASSTGGRGGRGRGEDHHHHHSSGSGGRGGGRGSGSHGKFKKREKLVERNWHEREVDDMMQGVGGGGANDAGAEDYVFNNENRWVRVGAPGEWERKVKMLLLNYLSAERVTLPGTVDDVQKISRDTQFNTKEFLRLMLAARQCPEPMASLKHRELADFDWIDYDEPCTTLCIQSPIYSVYERFAPGFKTLLTTLSSDPLKFINNLIETFKSLTLPHNTVRLHFWKLEDIKLPDFFDTNLFGNRSIIYRVWNNADSLMGGRHTPTANLKKRPPLRDLMDYLLVEASTDLLSAIASSSSGRCFFLKMMAHTLEEICHRCFPGSWFNTMLSRSRTYESYKYPGNWRRQDVFKMWKNEATSEIHRDILLCCRLLGLSELNHGGMHNWFIDHSDLEKRNKRCPGSCPPWEDPMKFRESSKATNKADYPPKRCWRSTLYSLGGPDGKYVSRGLTIEDLGPEFNLSPNTIGTSARLYRLLISRALHHIMDVKNGKFAQTPTWSGKKLRSNNWGKAIVFRAMRHQIALDRAMLNHCLKISRTKLHKLEAKEKQEVPSSGAGGGDEKKYYKCFFGRMSYDPLTIVFGFLHGEGLGTPPYFYAKLWGRRGGQRSPPPTTTTTTAGGDGQLTQQKQHKKKKRGDSENSEEDGGHSMKIKFCSTCQRRGTTGPAGCCGNHLHMLVCRICRQRGSHLAEQCPNGPWMCDRDFRGERAARRKSKLHTKEERERAKGEKNWSIKQELRKKREQDKEWAALEKLE